MNEIANKIESIRNMKNDLNSIKLMSQRNADKMLQHLADFRNRICNEMSKIENNYQSGRKYRQNLKINSDKRENSTTNSISDCNGSEDLKRMSEMFLKWKGYSSMSTVSTDPSSSHNASNVLQNNKECNSSVDSMSAPHEVIILFSKQLPYTIPDSLPAENETKTTSSAPFDKVQDQTGSEILQNESHPITEEKVDKLTKKLKEIQMQNEELQNVNENIQNLLLKLNDLKYANTDDAETADKLDTVKKESQMSSVASYHGPEIVPETIMKAEDYQQFAQSVEITNTIQNKMLTKINVAKLIIRRLRSCGNFADHEHKYKVRVRQAEQSITLKAHYNKPQ